MNEEINYLKEHLYEIYKYKKSMKDLTYDMDLEHLLRTCKALDYSQKEIERLNNIIKEIREYINRELLIKYKQDFQLVEISHINKILEILDKENK